MKQVNKTQAVSAWTKKIETQFLRATDDQIEYGLTWYKKANHYCQGLAIAYDMPLDTVVKVLSALSPASKWDRNKSDTSLLLSVRNLPWDYVKNLPFGTYKSNVLKALRIANNEEDLLPKSKKTYAFYQNIMLNPDHVTVDRHAITALGGKQFLKRIQSKTASGAYTVTKNHYHKAEHAYRLVANKYLLHPYELQAIVWLVERETKKSATK